MNPCAILHFLFFGLPLIVGPNVPAQEVSYEITQLGSAVAVVSVQESAQALSAIGSQDGTVFKLHRANGVFVDVGGSNGTPLNVQDSGLIRITSQVRSASGVDLVFTLKQSAYVEPFLTAEGLRYVFIARQDTDAKPARSPEVAAAAPEAENKIAELRGLVRDLSLEVVTLKKQLAEKQ